MLSVFGEALPASGTTRATRGEVPVECPSASSREVHARHTHTLCRHCVKCACPAPEPPSNLPQLIPAPRPLQLLQQEGREQTGLRLPPGFWHSPGPPPHCPQCWELLGAPGSLLTAGGVPFAPSEEAARNLREVRGGLCWAGVPRLGVWVWVWMGMCVCVWAASRREAAWMWQRRLSGLSAPLPGTRRLRGRAGETRPLETRPLIACLSLKQREKGRSSLWYTISYFVGVHPHSRALSH